MCTDLTYELDGEVLRALCIKYTEPSELSRLVDLVRWADCWADAEAESFLLLEPILARADITYKNNKK